MTNRELFHATMNFENGQNLLHLEHGFWPELLADWRKDNLGDDVADPELNGVTPERDVFDYFNVCKMAYCPVNQFLIPPFEEQIIKESEGRKTIKDSWGNIVEVRTDGASLPHIIDFAIKDKSDYLEIRDRLTGNIKERANVYDLSIFGSSVKKQQDSIVGLHINGPFAFLRNLMGVENAMIFPYTDPELTRMILDNNLQICKQAGENVIEACNPEISFIWEDRSYKNAQWFRHLCLMNFICLSIKSGLLL